MSIWLLYQRGVTAGYSGRPTSHRPLHVIFSGGFMLLILAGRCSCSERLLREAIPSDHAYGCWSTTALAFLEDLGRSIEALGIDVLKTPVRMPKSMAHLGLSRPKFPQLENARDDGAGEAQKMLAAQCAGCHMAH